MTTKQELELRVKELEHKVTELQEERDALIQRLRESRANYHAAQTRNPKC